MTRAPIRQGDILLMPATTIPANTVPVPRDRGRVILAYGEATGHAHVLDGEAILLATDVREMRDRFLRVEREAILVHGRVDTLTGGDHKPLTVPPGYYRVIRQREHDPERDRLVAD